MDKLCRLFGYSRQALYQEKNRSYKESLDEEIILEMIRNKRTRLKKVGGRKLLEMLAPEINRHGFKMGRDAFFDLLKRHGLIIRKRKRKAITTFSNHWLYKYPNLIKDLEIVRPNQVWVCDITYIETDQGFMYLFLITDAYSRKIIGYHLSGSLRAGGAIKALEKAIQDSAYPLDGLIHHSDRGIQYCSQDYTSILHQYGIKISMSAKGDPLENAIAERVNGILKDEWINSMSFTTKAQASIEIEQIIDDYNNLRPHLSIDMLTPEQAYQTSGLLRKRWKNYYNKKPTVISTDPIVQDHVNQCIEG